MVSMEARDDMHVVMKSVLISRRLVILDDRHARALSHLFNGLRNRLRDIHDPMRLRLRKFV